MAAHTPTEPSKGDLRAWLRVPPDIPLPPWVSRHLGAEVARELRAREGRPTECAVFGVVDLETSGPSSRRDRICEIGLVVQVGGASARGLALMVESPDPGPSLRSLAERGQFVALPDEEALVRAFSKQLQSWRVEVLVAHNARFDRTFLERAWREYALESPLPPFVCSVRVAKRWLRAPDYRLDTLVDQLSIARRLRHRALDDALMTADLWRELLPRGGLYGVHTVEALLATGGDAASGRPARRGIRVTYERASRSPAGTPGT